MAKSNGQQNNGQQITDMARFGSTRVIDTTGYQPSDQVAIAAQHVAWIRQAITEFNTAVGNIKTNGRYSDIGKAQALAELAPQYQTRLSQLAVVIGNMQKAVADLRAQTSVTDAASSDPVVTAIRAMEIRAALPKDKLLILTVFTDAITNGDREVYDALRLAPPFMKLLTPTDLAVGEASWEAKRDPAKAKKIADLVNAINVVSAEVDRARKIVETETGVKVPSLITRLAAGGV